MKLETINWPVAYLGKIEVKKKGTVSYKEVELYDLEEKKIVISQYVIDDSSIQQPTLGKRRLFLKSNGITILPINKIIYFLVDLIKLAQPNTWFIDNSGNIFTYKKAISAKLSCHRIKNILPSTGMGAVIEVEGVPQRFKVMYSPNVSQQYVGLLQFNHSYLLYGLYEEPFKASRRKI